jgi:hypothetical protein
MNYPRLASSNVARIILVVGISLNGRTQEFMAFFSKTIAERTEKGVRQSVEEDGSLVNE